MPWPASPASSGVAQHVIQRGCGRAACFFGRPDRVAFLQLLEGLSRDFECRLHAYVLMGNHVHLLLTSGEHDGVAALMQTLRAGYLRYADEAHALGDRAGSLMAAGFESSTIHVSRHLLHCMRYIELNPVRAGMVRRPEAYRWSSYAANAAGQADGLVTPHPFYLALGRTPELRQAAYRTSVETLLRGRSVAYKL